MIKIDFTTKSKESTCVYTTNRYGEKCLLDKDGRYHSQGDFPSLIDINETEIWHVHGFRHRKNGKPAVIYKNGSKEWYSHGVKIRSENP